MQTSLGGRIGHALSVFTTVWHAPYTCATCPICHIIRGGFMTLQRCIRCKTANSRKDGASPSSWIRFTWRDFLWQVFSFFFSHPVFSSFL